MAKLCGGEKGEGERHKAEKQAEGYGCAGAGHKHEEGEDGPAQQIDCGGVREDAVGVDGIAQSGVVAIGNSEPGDGEGAIRQRKGTVRCEGRCGEGVALHKRPAACQCLRRAAVEHSHGHRHIDWVGGMHPKHARL
ncbi:hypothetical protein GOP47_0024666 [Adiantum capillus-veneris]|uniref:Uncharacterized protein n=1 Tax=Adiantum capillus-veneris TaxID=13818 RepID=A0A9D4U260_ADICA|nr:hypothetical protein GOP47_0024666 [Adiantum capillus-veneris]